MMNMWNETTFHLGDTVTIIVGNALRENCKVVGSNTSWIFVELPDSKETCSVRGTNIILNERGDGGHAHRGPGSPSAKRPRLETYSWLYVPLINAAEIKKKGSSATRIDPESIASVANKFPMWDEVVLLLSQHLPDSIPWIQTGKQSYITALYQEQIVKPIEEHEAFQRLLFLAKQNSMLRSATCTPTKKSTPTSTPCRVRPSPPAPSSTSGVPCSQHTPPAAEEGEPL
jgi:hypothetical protein